MMNKNKVKLTRSEKVLLEVKYLLPLKTGQIYSVLNGRKIEGENHEKAATYSKSISS